MDEGKDKDESVKAQYGVFIPTHGRAKSQITMNMLLDCGFTGDIWLVCDNLDDSLDEYIELYGERVLVFDKRDWAMRTDRVTNDVELGTVLYARNYIQEIGKQKGYDVIGVFDDDLDSFSIRYEKDGGLQTHLMEDGMDELIAGIVEFVIDGNIMAMSIAHNGGYFGGLEGEFKEGLTRNPSGAWFMNLTEKLPQCFRGIVNEDSIYVRDAGRVGGLVFKLMDVMFSTPKRGTNEGGHSEMYSEMSKYIHSSYVMIASPSTMSMLEDGSRRTNRKAIHSEIISERWRKDG